MESLLEAKHGKWSEAEDSLLRLAIGCFGEKHWNQISCRVPGRSPIQCLHRWTKILKPGLVKGAWKDAEDDTLRHWVLLNGPQRWSHCSKLIPGRSGKQCRERWFNNLDPNIVKGQWTDSEDRLIFDLYRKEGPKWSLIAQALPGRTENSIKNRFYSSLRKVRNDEIRNKKQEQNRESEEMELVQHALVLEKFIEESAMREMFEYRAKDENCSEIERRGKLMIPKVVY
jgi:hypothetical protein